ncbi:PREDICTED: uncharacterized protein LOC105570855, partial [Vollenhovia emeryi]|uniref:uncharacterized protein LOC105570855 n=1 Tax=Vollenhovia emeryi TaxID=411798 RepID=UPI0005F51A5E
IDPANHGLACSFPPALDERVKVLGIVWNPSRDVFTFTVTLDSAVPRCKRTILSTIARLYDPLGWATPVTVAAKILMQALWRSQLGWDQDLDPPLLKQWHLIYKNLVRLNEVTLPRWTHSQPQASFELHGFADASTHAYAASIYLKACSPSGEVTVSLIAGKSRVAPIKPFTIPRLELSAALLLSRLMQFVRGVLRLDSVSCTCWTDSTVVLSWLQSHPSRWTTFVANRVAQIQSTLSGATWRHVPTAYNPADCASRGILGDELLAHTLWWHGPPWLCSPSQDWPPNPINYQMDAPLEERVRSHHIAEAPIQWDLATRYSSWNKLIRVTAYVLRFANACRRSKIDGHPLGIDSLALSSDECARSTIVWIKRIQSELFPAELHALLSNRSISSKSPIIALNPFLDHDRVLRVGGRLRNAPIPYAQRHPIILSPHPLVRLIVAQTHLRHLHAGTQLTLSTLRRTFWITRARSVIKSVIHDCVACTRERAVVPT